MTPRQLRDAANTPWEGDATGATTFLGKRVYCCLFCGWPCASRMEAVACEARDQEHVGEARRLFDSYVSAIDR